MLRQITTFGATLIVIFITNVNLRAELPTVQLLVDDTTTEFSINILSYADFSINWGDGASDDVAGPTPKQVEVKHTYQSSGARTISISGAMINHLSLNERMINSITFGDKLSDFSQFKELYINKNNLTTIDVSKLTNLDILSCADNSLTHLDLSKNTKLGRLIVAGNSSLSQLDLSSNSQLMHLNAAKVGITSIDLTDNLQLKEILLHENQINTLDLSGMEKLEKLYCPDNNISNLNLSDSPNLKTLVCGNNKLQEIVLNPSVTSLEELQCQNNILSLATLPRVSKATVADTNFTYSPQDSLSLTDRASEMTIDLSDQISVSGVFPETGTSPVASRVRWVNASNNSTITAYTVANGVYTFTLDPGQQHFLKAEIKNNGYSNLTLRTKVISLPAITTGINTEPKDSDFSYEGGVVYFKSGKAYDVVLVDLQGKIVFSDKNINTSLDIRSVMKNSEIYILSITNNENKWVKVLR